MSSMMHEGRETKNRRRERESPASGTTASLPTRAGRLEAGVEREADDATFKHPVEHPLDVHVELRPAAGFLAQTLPAAPVSLHYMQVRKTWPTQTSSPSTK